MVTTAILALTLLFCQAQSQLCGSGLFPGALGFENGLYGSGTFGPLAQSFNTATPPCGQSVTSCGIPSPPCGIQTASSGIQASPCSIKAPILNNIAPNFIPSQTCGQCSPFGSNLAPITNPSCSICDYCQPQVPVTSVVDNNLANTLANAIQLLIVSNLLESTMSNPCTSSLGCSPVCERSYPCANVIEIASPDICPCNQIVACEPVSPYIGVPCCQEPVVTYAPCVEVSPCGPVFGPSFGSNFAIDNCGLVNPYSNNFGCSDSFGVVNAFPNSFGFSENCGLVNPFGNGFGCLDSVFSPVAADVVFPAEIPAQLLCNFGYTPANVPCVSVNVEALPLDYCSCTKGFVFSG